MSNSEIILSNQTHPGDSTEVSVTSDKFKGDGYYGRSDGLHTVSWSVDGFTGTIHIQGTLSVDPQETDWSTVHSVTLAQDSVNSYANFTGNYVWIRAVVSYTDGSVNSIRLNH